MKCRLIPYKNICSALHNYCIKTLFTAEYSTFKALPRQSLSTCI